MASGTKEIITETTKVKSKFPMIPGTKPSIRNAQLLISTGIISLDNIVEEDKYGLYAKTALKYCMAEGIVTSQPILIASQDVQPSQFVSELPAVINDSDLYTKTIDNADEQMKIAWRYQNMKIIDSSPMANQIFGHYYDLSKPMQQDLLEQADIKQWYENNLQGQNNLFENTAYTDLLYTIQETLHNGQYFISETTEKKKILRIIIHSLGSRLWLSDTEKSSNRDLLKFLYCFRALLRNSYAVGIITVPISNFDNTDAVIERIEHLSDIAVRLESFAGSVKETNPLFKDYHGLLHIEKLSALNTLAPRCAEFRDLVFKLRRKKFIIEVLHLPPEFEDTVQREQDEAIVSSTGCMSGSRKNILEF
ncbi:hypothetical protein ACFW04_008412 [Cataglyphis niger]